MNPKQSFFQRILGTKVAEAPSIEAPVIDPNIEKIKAGLAYAETRGVKGNKHTFSQASGEERLGEVIGKYQVTEGELKTYAPKYIGRNMSIKEFRNSPSAQEEYIQGKIKTLLGRGNTPQQVADIHRRGVKGSSPAGSNIYQDPDYVATFNAGYNLQ